tara:strand:- start:5834 stop:6616 length:783 start_codon:yes stop_codon:yes gene_type:complete
MEFLPNLEIQEDLSNLDSDNEEELGRFDVIQEDLSGPLTEPSPMDIFTGKPTNGVKIGKPTNKKRVVIKNPKDSIASLKDPKEEIESQQLSDIEECVEEPVPTPTPKKVKKPLSEKQKAHLDRIRKLALVKKKEKAAMRKKALAKVNEEYESKKQYKKRTIKVNDEIERIDSPPPNPIKERVEKHQAPKKELTDDDSFINFMDNMGKYQKYMINYENKQKKTKPPIQVVKKIIPQASVPQQVPSHLKMKDNDPYANIFSW